MNKYVLKVKINNIQALVQVVAGRRLGDNPLSQQMMASFLMHIYATRPQ